MIYHQDVYMGTPLHEEVCDALVGGDHQHEHLSVTHCGKIYAGGYWYQLGLCIIVEVDNKPVISLIHGILLIEEADDILFSIQIFDSGLLYEDEILPHVNLQTRRESPCWLACPDAYPTPCVLQRRDEHKAFIVKH